MQKGYCIFLIVVSTIILSCDTTEAVFEDAFCIVDITIIDPETGAQPHRTVVVKDGKILINASTGALRLSPKNTIVSGKGHYLIPGLWDAHVHFAYIEELAPRMFDLFLAFGITSVRDTGGRTEFVKQWKDSALMRPTAAPRLMMAGPLLDGKPNVYDGSDTRHPELSVGLATVAEVTDEVSNLIAQGVDFLKAYEMLSPDQFKKVIELAEANNLKVTGHVPLSMDVIAASNAGLHSMEHLRNLELSCASNADELLRKRQNLLSNPTKDLGGVLRSKIHQAQQQIAIANYDEEKATEVLQVLYNNNTWQIPTLALNTFFTGKYYQQTDFQQTYAYLPDSLRNYWLRRSKELETYPVSDFRKRFDAWNIEMVNKIHDAGIPIMAGTDTPIAFLVPGRSLHEELSALVRAGLSPLEALRTATINPARYFNIEQELGGVREGMWADLVILKANPLEDIANTMKIEAVVKQGRYYDSKAIEGLLGKYITN